MKAIPILILAAAVALPARASDYVTSKIAGNVEVYHHKDMKPALLNTFSVMVVGARKKLAFAKKQLDVAIAKLTKKPHPGQLSQALWLDLKYNFVTTDNATALATLEAVKAKVDTLTTKMDSAALKLCDAKGSVVGGSDACIGNALACAMKGAGAGFKGVLAGLVGVDYVYLDVSKEGMLAAPAAVATLIHEGTHLFLGTHDNSLIPNWNREGPLAYVLDLKAHGTPLAAGTAWHKSATDHGAVTHALALENAYAYENFIYTMPDEEHPATALFDTAEAALAALGHW